MFKLACFLALIVLCAWVLIFQLLIPWVQGLPFFPVFRSKQLRALEDEMAEVQQEIFVGSMRNTLAAMKPQPQSNNAVMDTNGESK